MGARLPFLDAARGLAVVAMLLANLVNVFAPIRPRWLGHDLGNELQMFDLPAPVPGLNGANAGVVSSRFSPDELTAYIGMFRGPQPDFFVARRASRSEPFGTPTLIYTLNTPGSEEYATVTADGGPCVCACLP